MPPTPPIALQLQVQTYAQQCAELEAQVQALTADRDEQAARVAELTGPEGPEAQLHTWQQAFEEEQERCAQLTQDLQATRAENVNLRRSLDAANHELLQLDGTVGMLRNELIQWQSGNK